MPFLSARRRYRSQAASARPIMASKCRSSSDPEARSGLLLCLSAIVACPIKWRRRNWLAPQMVACLSADPQRRNLDQWARPFGPRSCPSTLASTAALTPNSPGLPWIVSPALWAAVVDLQGAVGGAQGGGVAEGGVRLRACAPPVPFGASLDSAAAMPTFTGKQQIPCS